MQRKLINLGRLEWISTGDPKTYNYLKNIMENYVFRLKNLPLDGQIFAHATPEEYAGLLLDIYVKDPQDTEPYCFDQIFNFTTSNQVDIFNLLCKLSLGLAKLDVNPLSILHLSKESLQETLVHPEAYQRFCGLVVLLNPEEYQPSLQSIQSLRIKLLNRRESILDIFSYDYNIDISVLFNELRDMLYL
ncbi:MAG: hypothetical protein LBL50_03885 [Candidatus Margulisbacteria bacterium]|jgi:hypothetical protein|nr:hypothetical protein [Candidatus Margulisiibacteriota bacterium]